MDTLLSMRVFAKVVETGNFAEAGRQLKLSPAMVTRHVQSLERRLGVRIINRTTQRFSLTEAGAVYHERCLAALAEIDDAEAAAGAVSQLPRGRLRISAGADFGPEELWPVVRDFLEAHPEVDVDLLLTDRVVDLIEDKVDLAVRMVERSLSPSLIARQLARSTMVLCASPAYLRGAGTPRTPEDLAGHRCLLYGEALRHEGWLLRRGEEQRRLIAPGRVQSNQIRLLRQAAVDGLGIAMQPTFNVWRDLAAGRLQTLLDEWDMGALAIHVVYPSRQFLPAKTRLFIDFLVSRFPKGARHDPWRERAQPSGSADA